METQKLVHYLELFGNFSNGELTFAWSQNLLSSATQVNSNTQHTTEQSGFGSYTFNNCNVTFNIAPKDGPCKNKRKRMIIYSDSESSQEF